MSSNYVVNLFRHSSGMTVALWATLLVNVSYLHVLKQDVYIKPCHYNAIRQQNSFNYSGK